MNTSIEAYLQNIQQDVLSTLSAQNFIKFKYIENFPTESGIYFIYDKSNTLVYIGAAMNIQKRCNQYISPTNTGATFRYNLIQSQKKQKDTITEIKKMKKLNAIYVDIIKNDYMAKFIKVKGKKSDVAYEELVYIAAFKPKLNKFNL